LDTAKPAAAKRTATAAPSGGSKKKQQGEKKSGGLDIADYLTLGKFCQQNIDYGCNCEL
jgi:hypothetical protein